MKSGKCAYLLMIALCFLVACDPPEESNNKDEGDKCGNEFVFSAHRHEMEVTDYLESPLRCVNYWANVTNVCTYEHVETHFWFIQRESRDETGTIVLAEIWYGMGFYSIPVTMNYDPETLSPTAGYDWQGYAEFGLKHSYGNGPGDFYMDIRICFPIKGDGEDDMQYFEEHIYQDLMFNADGKKHKG